MRKFEVATVSGSWRSPSFENALVEDAMRHGVLECRPETPLVDVARTMTNYHVHAVVVTSSEPVDRTSERHAWGVVTDLQVMQAGADAPDRTAGDTASRDFVSVRAQDSLADATRAMAAGGATHAVVVDETGSHPIGVLSTLDVAGVIAWGRA